MEAIVLAGGLGTRLTSVVKDVPKPMADINGFPFLKYLLDFLISYGMKHIILSVGYKRQSIEEYFGTVYKDIPISYAIEESPLGTGGAVFLALKESKEPDVFVLNGDSFFNLGLTRYFEQHRRLDSDITIALKPVSQFDRYGVVEVENERVTSFTEKTSDSDNEKTPNDEKASNNKKISNKKKNANAKGLINAGVYLIKKEAIASFHIKEPFSFEIDIMQKHVNDLKIAPFISKGYFIDIGIPEDYQKAQSELSNYI